MKEVLNLKLKKSEIQLLTLLMIILVIAVIYMFLWKPLNQDKTELAFKVKELRVEHEALTATSMQKHVLENNIKENKIQLDTVNRTLLPDITQEHILILIDKMKNDIHMAFSDVTLGKKEYFDSEAKDLNGFSIKISFGFKGAYNQVKYLMDWIHEQHIYMVIESLSMNNDITTNDISGQVSITMYGMEDTAIKSWYNEIDLANPGKEDIFKPFKSYKDTISSTYEATPVDVYHEKYDFYIQLEPIFADYPAITIAKNDKNASTFIHSDNEAFEDVTVELFKKNNTYYYRYKTEQANYPQPYERGQIYYPGDKTVIKVFSQKRISENDKNGINLILINKTDKEFVTYIINDDQKFPRVKIKAKEGKVKVN